jgi:hypothetical protein
MLLLAVFFLCSMRARILDAPDHHVPPLRHKASFLCAH